MPNAEEQQLLLDIVAQQRNVAMTEAARLGARCVLLEQQVRALQIEIDNVRKNNE